MIHKLKNPSSFIVVVLRSLRHRGCVRCNKPIRSFEESVAHWNQELQKTDDVKLGERFEFEVNNE